MSDTDPLIVAATVLLAMDVRGLMAFFWFTIVFELPRYVLSFPAIVVLALVERRQPDAPTVSQVGKVSIIVAGHNEADCIETCIRSLRAQTLRDAEIVCVSDGSMDATFQIMQRLHREGLIDRVAECQIRGGKPAALNLGARLASGDILIVVDCDCSFRPTSLAELIAPFADPPVGAVAGRVLVRNPDASLVTSLQAIEYLTGMTLGRAQMAMFGQLSLVSGAIGAFRRSVWEQIGGMDPVPGEDFDFCLRMRKIGHEVAFAPRAVAFTDVPVAFTALLRQRKRWERDALWIRFRKHKGALNPFSRHYLPREAFHHADFLVFTVLPALVMPLFLVYLFTSYGIAALGLLLAMSIGLFVLDMFVLACAILAHGHWGQWRLIWTLPLYGAFQGYVLRIARLKEFVEEWIWSKSRTDNYCPPKVNAWNTWR